MKKITTLALASALATTALSVRAQITLDGTITAAEIGTSGNKYQSLGRFTTSHTPVSGGPTGFGNAGLLQMYGANSGTKLYIGLAGTIETGGNNFQLYMDLPNKTGVPAGTALPAITSTTTVLGANADPTKAGNTIAGTKLDLEADAIIAFTGQGNLQAAVYKSATSGVATSLATSVATDGTPTAVASTAATGDYALFANTRVAYKQSATGLSGNPGNANGGGDGSYALEYEFDRTALGLPSGASIVKVFAAYVSPDGYWSSDIIPETAGGTQGTVTTGGLNNIGFAPDFTNTTLFPGTQAASLNLVVLSSRKADDAVVALSVFPNPSQGRSTVAYQVRDQAETVNVVITDLLGRRVQTLLNQRQNPGIKELQVDNGALAAGTYLVKVQVGDRTATRKLVLN